MQQQSLRLLQVDASVLKFTVLNQQTWTNETSLVSGLSAFVALTTLTLITMSLYMAYRVYKLGKKSVLDKEEAQK